MTETSMLTRFSDELAAAVEKAGGSVVRVDSRRKHNPASGIVWAPGVVVTTDHALEREDDLTIGLPDGREVPATIAGRDPGSDIAVLKFQAEGVIPAARAADSKIGHFVLAVGRPGTLAATSGVVSAVGGPVRTWRGGRIESFIRTDAVLYPGFSGGPLVNAAGEVVGMTTTHFGGSMAIPAAIVARVADALLAGGKVKRGYLGVTSQPIAIPASLKGKVAPEQETGLLVVGVEADGPAEKGGVLVGDILVGFAGSPVRDTDDLQLLLTADRAGQQAPLQVLRGGEPTTITVTVGERA